MVSLRENLALTVLVRAFAFGDFSEQLRINKQRKLGHPCESSSLIGGLLKARMQVERFCFLEQLIEQLVLHIGESRFQFTPLEPRGQLKGVPLVEVEPG